MGLIQPCELRWALKSTRNQLLPGENVFPAVVFPQTLRIQSNTIRIKGQYIMLQCEHARQIQFLYCQSPAKLPSIITALAGLNQCLRK